ncbi:hypothetical protein [Cupriavidus basilensis]|uniref:hypothetical protein n=1 Tax=Cupriavidus basilensis TaxID=68895 RepID=UPI0039F73173
MSHFRPYWTRHPHQLRIAAFLCLITVPVWLPIVMLWLGRWEVVEWLAAAWKGVKGIYSELWECMTHKLPAKPLLPRWLALLLITAATLADVFNVWGVPFELNALSLVLDAVVILLLALTAPRKVKAKKPRSGWLGAHDCCAW